MFTKLKVNIYDFIENNFRLIIDLIIIILSINMLINLFFYNSLETTTLERGL